MTFFPFQINVFILFTFAYLISNIYLNPEFKEQIIVGLFFFVGEWGGVAGGFSFFFLFVCFCFVLCCCSAVLLCCMFTP